MTFDDVKRMAAESGLAIENCSDEKGNQLFEFAERIRNYTIDQVIDMVNEVNANDPEK